VPGFVIDDFMLLEMNCRMFIRKLAYLDGIIVDKIIIPTSNYNARYFLSCNRILRP
jgi:hypothetical protein